jgi:peptide/nickel transport system ATP-binding protein
VTATANTISTQGAEARDAGDVVLDVNDLSVAFPTEEGVVKAVSNLSYQARLGRTLAIVGESGSGKSVSSMAVLGLHNAKRTQITGSIKLDGLELVGAPASTFQKVRSTKAAMVFQDPQSSLHPFHKVGKQIAEAYQAHNKVSKQIAHKRAVEMLDLVGIPNPQRRASQYPHEFSGGMRQRAMIALGLVNNPKLLIADEPTTALDVTVQAQILDLLQELQRDFNSAIIIITHDLGVVAEMADEVLVMYAGRAVEVGPTRELLTHPEMPYTWGLLSSVPDVSADTDARLIPIPGNPPSLLDPPPGCPFNPRCAHRDKVPGDLCRTELPPLIVGARPGHTKRCHLPNPDSIYEAEVLPEIAPDLVELIVEDGRGDLTTGPDPDATPGGGSVASENG